MFIEEKQRILKEDFNYNISKNVEKEVIDMCNLSMGIYEVCKNIYFLFLKNIVWKNDIKNFYKITINV